ncbi:hypothetical protein OG558_09875 [Kribbella sp. NBC_01510]|uniref:hypothetical protein n=1 Tax=Kribbella sp. NBC_01510 TaxID=2903581 RepID=UPI00386C0E64
MSVQVRAVTADRWSDLVSVFTGTMARTSGDAIVNFARRGEASLGTAGLSLLS